MGWLGYGKFLAMLWLGLGMIIVSVVMIDDDHEVIDISYLIYLLYLLYYSHKLIWIYNTYH